MTKGLVLFILTLAILQLAAQQPQSAASAAEATPAQLRQQLAQKDLQIAQLMKQLHAAENSGSVCQAALTAVFSQQADQDEKAISAAQAAVTAATPSAPPFVDSSPKTQK